MERITKRKTFGVSGVFLPQVKVGDMVRPGDLIGTAKVPNIVEIFPLEGGRALVDEGVFVLEKTPVLEYKRGFRKEIVYTQHEGVVRLMRHSIAIVTDDVIEEVRATTWGRLMSMTEVSYVLDIKYMKVPIFVSKGSRVEAELVCLLGKGVVVAPHHITEEVRERLVLLPGAISKETYAAIMSRGALGVIAPSIDWNDYLSVFSQEGSNVGVLHGFGMFPLWRWYYHLLSKMTNVVVEVDFAASQLYLPISDILMGNLEQDLLLFKEYWWGKQVKELQHESGALIATLETGEQTPVQAEELFNIR